MMAARVNAYTAPVTVLIPQKAISVISAPGGVFHHPEADRALFSVLTGALRTDIKVLTLDCGINDPEFAQACVKALLENIELRKLQPKERTI